MTNKSAKVKPIKDSLSLTESEKNRMGENIRRLRDEKDISQDRMSKLLQCTPQFISDVERGRYALASKSSKPPANLLKASVKISAS